MTGAPFKVKLYSVAPTPPDQEMVIEPTTVFIGVICVIGVGGETAGRALRGGGDAR